MEFISSLTESKLFPSNNSLRKFTSRDILDLCLMYFCAITILKDEFKWLSMIQKYCMMSYKGGNWDRITFASNDLVFILHVILGSGAQADDSRSKLKDQENSKLLLDRVNLSANEIARYLHSISENQHVNPSRFLLKLDHGLAIEDSNYHSVRRLVQDWPSLTHHEKQLVITRMLQFFRIHAPKAEMLKYIEQLSKSQRLELKGVVNPEK